MEKSPTPMIADKAVPAAMVRLAKKWSGTMGSGARRSMKKKATNPSDAHGERRRGGWAGAPFSSPRDGEHEGHQGSGEDGRPGDVEVARHGSRFQVRNSDQREAQGHRADRDIDPEDPRPAPVVRDGAAEDGADEDRDGESRADDGHVARPLPRRGDPGDDGLRHQLQARGAHPLQDACRDEPRHVLGEAAGQGGGQEHDQ